MPLHAVVIRPLMSHPYKAEMERARISPDRLDEWGKGLGLPLGDLPVGNRRNVLEVEQQEYHECTTSELLWWAFDATFNGI